MAIISVLADYHRHCPLMILHLRKRVVDKIYLVHSQINIRHRFKLRAELFSRHAPPIVIYHDRYDYRHYRQPDCYRHDKNLVQRTECRRCIFNRDAIPIIKEIDRVNQVGCAVVLKLEIIFFLFLVQVPNNFRAKRPRRFQIVILADLVFFGVRNDYAVLADNHLHIGFALRHGLCNHLLN